MDDGSNDKTVEVIKKYEKYITHWESVKDKGQSDAIQKGLNIATGYVVNWLNSDDYYNPGVLDKVGELFTDSKTKVVCGKSRIFGDGYVDRFSQGTDIYESLEKTIGWARIDQPETFFRLEDWKAIGGVNSDFHFVMDKELWIRYLIKFGLEGIKQLDDIMVNFRLHGESKTVSLQAKFDKEEDALYSKIASVNAILDFIESDKDVKINEIYSLENKEFIRRILTFYALKKADHYYFLENKTNSQKFLSKINPTLLSESDKTLYQKLKFRNKIPLFLRKLLK